MKKKCLSMVKIRYLAILICFLTINLIHGRDDGVKKTSEKEIIVLDCN